MKRYDLRRRSRRMQIERAEKRSDVLWQKALSATQSTKARGRIYRVCVTASCRPGAAITDGTDRALWRQRLLGLRRLKLLLLLSGGI